jgi:hypothetical protein
MIASKLDKLDLSGNQPVISRTLDDIAKDIRKYLSGAVESVIKAGQALQEGRDMHPSNIDFHNWCTKEFPDLNSKMRERMMQVGRRFDTTFMSQRLPVTVLYELAAPSVPDELVEDIISSDKPVKVKEVQEAKAGYKAVQEDESNADLKEKVESKEIKPVEAAKIANDRFEKKKKEMEERDNTFDLVEHISSTENYEIGVVATNFAASMEQLISKFDGDQVTHQIYLALKEDVINIKIPALHKMSDILLELCERLPLTNIKTLN